MERIDPEFALLIRSLLPALEEHPGAVFGLWPDLRLAYLNPGWFSFAAANDGEPAVSTRWPIGTCIADVPAPPLTDFYRILYQRCLAANARREFIYECSSPQVNRQFQMTVRPLGQGSGLLVVNSLRVENPHDCQEHDSIESDYRSDDGIIRMCMNCRKVNRLSDPAAWDWVPAWVRNLPSQVSHGLCPVCGCLYHAQLEGTEICL